MARRIPARMPGQWSDSPSAFDHESVESKYLQASSDDASYPEPDVALIGELLEDIERNPPAQEARVLLMQQYATCGWHDAACDEAHQVLNIDPSVYEAQTYLWTHTAGQREVGGGGKEEGEGKGKGRAKSVQPDTNSKAKERDSKGLQRQRGQAPEWRPKLIPITSPKGSLQELEDGYVALLKNANLLLQEMKFLKDLKAPNCENAISDLSAITQGRMSNVVKTKTLKGIKAVADEILSKSKTSEQSGLDIAMNDLADVAWWSRDLGNCGDSSYTSKNADRDHSEQEEVRKALVQRVKGLKALLPNSLHQLADSAMMHADHELLQRQYVNNETMVSLDPVADIPRTNFWTSEDGYAWDMAELAGAIKSGKGVMRNPLSKQMFTRADIRSIIQHPLGKGLQALRVQQSKLKRGVRPQTISELSTLGKALLEDKSEDGRPSQVAVEAFIAYLETLPSSEQKAIDDLKVPATDSHTGVPFDTSIGEAVTDVQGNRVCSHKVGDFLAQAASYLKGSKEDKPK
ncbi:MAG: hypothetical protein Q9195_001267 [Heterodermia aff. obscurata]